MYLYLFNPDNDLALGNNSPFYQSPVSARQMAADLAVLPAWVVPNAETMVAVPGKDFAEAWERESGWDFSVRWVTLNEGVACCHAIRPWGWNAALVQELKRHGAAVTVLPTAEELTELRRLSSRLCAVDMLGERPREACFCGTSWACRSVEEVESVLRLSSSAGQMLLKAPWSGSGKGLRRVKGAVMDTLTRNWCMRMLATQQAVVVEPVYQRVVDFAMEFLADGRGGVTFVGYSLFQTDGNGAYKGNSLKSDECIVEELNRLLPVGALEKARVFLLTQLPRLLRSGYKGFLGVDMMVCRFDEEPAFRLHPCVEINLRMNMGVVAHEFYHRWLSPMSEGLFRIDYFPSPALLYADHCQQKNAHLLVMRDGRMECGYVSLNPIGPDTRYRAAVWVHHLIG